MKNEIIIFEEENIKLEVNMKDETVWLSQSQMAELFEKGRSTITEHINNIFNDGELDEEVSCRKFRHDTSSSNSPSLKILLMCSVIVLLPFSNNSAI